MELGWERFGTAILHWVGTPHAVVELGVTGLVVTELAMGADVRMASRSPKWP